VIFFLLYLSISLSYETHKMVGSLNCDENTLFEVGDTQTYTERLKIILKCDSLVSLTIQITSNKGWVVFSHIQGISDHSCSYSYDTKLGSLPDDFANLKHLQNLDLSYLGIDNLPNSLFKLQNLKSLDISFNKIQLSKELDKILSLENLELLKIYGCDFSNDDLERILRKKPDLKVLYTEKHLHGEWELKK